MCCAAPLGSFVRGRAVRVYSWAWEEGGEGGIEENPQYRLLPEDFISVCLVFRREGAAGPCVSASLSLLQLSSPFCSRLPLPCGVRRKTGARWTGRGPPSQKPHSIAQCQVGFFVIFLVIPTAVVGGWFFSSPLASFSSASLREGGMALSHRPAVTLFSKTRRMVSNFLPHHIQPIAKKKKKKEGNLWKLPGNGMTTIWSLPVGSASVYHCYQRITETTITTEHGAQMLGYLPNQNFDSRSSSSCLV